jgi:hypothetical protein
MEAVEYAKTGIDASELPKVVKSFDRLPYYIQLYLSMIGDKQKTS